MEGFIPHSRASLMLDLVTIAMIVVIPLMWLGISYAKNRKFVTHAAWMKILSIVLIVAVGFFEIEMRLMGWEHLAEPSPYFETWVYPSLWIHLFFSISAFFLLITTLSLAWKKFPKPPSPASHSSIHRKLGMTTFIFLAGTTITGWVFYWLAFVAN